MQLMRVVGTDLTLHPCNVGCVTAGHARHNSINVGCVSAGQVRHNLFLDSPKVVDSMEESILQTWPSSKTAQIKIFPIAPVGIAFISG